MAMQNYSTSGLVTGGLGAAPAPAPYPVQYVRVSGGVPTGSARTTVHAVLDYDDDDDDQQDTNLPSSSLHHNDDHFAGGPILIKNGSVPVVPLYSYSSTYHNGTLVHIPADLYLLPQPPNQESTVLWTALSLALGLEIKGDVIRGTPCIKRHHQLFCPTAGNSYPIERIELFIDENKALMKRMYGEFTSSPEAGPPGQELYESDRRRRNGFSSSSAYSDAGNNGYSNKPRPARQTNNAAPGAAGIRAPNTNTTSDSGRVDACQSKVEIVTPYWAANSAGKVRAIVNTQHFEQAIHQEVCSKVQTNRCGGDCGCEQKYKWHRLLAYDPDNDCKGIFMDWFLFPSCCVCRCNPTGFASTPHQQATSRRQA